MSYSIDVHIPPSTLSQLYDRGETLVFVRHVSTVPPYPALPVAWIAFQPYESNRVAWGGRVRLFATTVEARAGAAIPLTCTTPLLEAGSAYEFGRGGFAKTFAPSELPNSYLLVNRKPEPWTFGLAQEIHVESAGMLQPITAITIRPEARAIFSPAETVTLFAGKGVRRGDVLERIPPGALTVALTASHPTATVVFDERTGRFVLRAI